mgnify:CR=1 FL=1
MAEDIVKIAKKEMVRLEEILGEIDIFLSQFNSLLIVINPLIIVH